MELKQTYTWHHSFNASRFRALSDTRAIATLRHNPTPNTLGISLSLSDTYLRGHGRVVLYEFPRKHTVASEVFEAPHRRVRVRRLVPVHAYGIPASAGLAGVPGTRKVTLGWPQPLGVV